MRNIYPKTNKTYLNKKIIVKEYFKIIIKYLKNKKKLSLIDVGCASGDFLSLLSIYNKFELSGIDFSKASLSLAKKKVPDASFKLINLNRKFKLKKKYDICTCLGTLSAFDDKFKIISKLLNIVKKKGEMIIFDLINEHDVNVIMRYQNNFDKKKRWLSGFNTFSKNYCINFLKSNSKIKSFKIIKFEIKKKLVKNKKNPMRSWTFNYNNKKQIVVGTGQLLNYYFIIIKLN